MILTVVLLDLVRFGIIIKKDFGFSIMKMANKWLMENSN